VQVPDAAKPQHFRLGHPTKSKDGTCRGPRFEEVEARFRDSSRSISRLPSKFEVKLVDHRVVRPAGWVVNDL
jgi:hypothetical protein